MGFYRLVGVWARRAVSIPLFFGLAALTLGGLPLWLSLAGLVDLIFFRRKRSAKTRVVLFFALYLACEVAGVLSALVVWVATIGRPLSALHANAALQRRWTDAIFFGAVRLFSLRLSVTGAEQPGPFLLFVRHASTADTVLAAALLANRQQLIMRYVLKSELLWDPCLDIVGRRLPNAFVDRSGDKSDVAAVARLTRHLDARSAVLIFPEGTRFSPGKLQRAMDKLRSGDRVELERIAAGYVNVLPPKLGGPLALLSAAPDLDVVFLEHTGFEGAESFAQFFSGGLIGKTIHARFRRVMARDIPREGRDLWLYAQWATCDAFVSAHKGTL